jgi:hypothetical protein
VPEEDDASLLFEPAATKIANERTATNVAFIFMHGAFRWVGEI